MTHEEEQAETAKDQANMTREEIVEQLEQKNEYVFDPEQFKHVEHHWVHRGAKLSCEGASHPHHSHFLH